MAQPAGSVGRELHRLAVFSGLIYAFYGDYNVNTGPIDVISFDPANPSAGFTSEATLHTEETWQGLAQGGKLYVPYLDPLGTLDGTQGQLAVATAPGSWTVITNVIPVPIHAGGFAVFGTDWFLSGAADEPDPPNGGATVWRSTDAGATWTVSLAPRPDLTNLARFHLPVVIGDVMQVFDSQEGHLYEWDGATWTDHGTVAPLHDISDAVPYTFNGVPFALCLDRGKDVGAVQTTICYSRTRTADDAHRAAIDAKLPVGMARDVCTDGTHIYLLGGDGTIWRGDTTGTWTDAVAPVAGIDPRSLAVLDGVAYLGTADSKLFSVPLP